MKYSYSYLFNGKLTTCKRQPILEKQPLTEYLLQSSSSFIRLSQTSAFGERVSSPTGDLDTTSSQRRSLQYESEASFRSSTGDLEDAEGRRYTLGETGDFRDSVCKRDDASYPAVDMNVMDKVMSGNVGWFISV